MIRLRPLLFNEKLYSFKPLLGYLIEEEQQKDFAALHAVENPFLLNRRAHQEFDEINITRFVVCYARILTKLSRHSFQIAFWVSKLVRPRYADAYISTLAYRKLYPGDQQRKLCLPRMLFAASMSKRFKKYGTAFIGIFLPSVQMHAWVIEDNTLADPYDNEWICYNPVAIIT